MSRTITVVHPGALSTVQDIGRTGYQRLGVSVSGAMDRDALVLGNRLVGNGPDDAAIEVTVGGAAFRFEDEAWVAVTGGDLGPTLDGLRMPGWTTVRVHSGGVLEFGGPSDGLRAYVCVAGGVATEPQLGSRSTHAGAGLGGVHGRALAEGDILPVGEPAGPVRPGRSIPSELRPSYANGNVDLRVIPGPQADVFSDAGLRTFFESEYTVTDRSDRQGIRFDGPEIATIEGRYDIVSDAVALGSVQVPGDGKPIVLMADRQTTGGYAKIGVVATVDLPSLAQAPPGARVRFHEIDVESARQLLLVRRRELWEADLAEAAEGSERRLIVSGVERTVRIGALPHGGDAWFTMAEVDGRAIDLHFEQIPPGAGV